MQIIQGTSDVYLYIKKTNPKKAYALTTTDVTNIKTTEIIARSNDQRCYNLMESLLIIPQLPKPDTLFLQEEIHPSALEYIIVEHLFNSSK